MYQRNSRGWLSSSGLRVLAVIILLTVSFSLPSIARFADSQITKECGSLFPPEVCGAYDPQILAGKSPTIRDYSQADIFTVLRNCEEVDADFVSLEDLDLRSNEIIQAIHDFLNGCAAKVYIDGRTTDGRRLMEDILGFQIGSVRSFAPTSGNAVFIGVTDSNFSCLGVSSLLPDKSQVFAYNSDREPCLFSMIYGNSLVFYDGTSGTSFRGNERLFLNLQQCLLGLPIPQANGLDGECLLGYNGKAVDPLRRLLDQIMIDGRDTSEHTFRTQLQVGSWYRLLIRSTVTYAPSKVIPEQLHLVLNQGTYQRFSFYNVRDQQVMEAEIQIQANQPTLGIRLDDDYPNDNSGELRIFLLTL